MKTDIGTIITSMVIPIIGYVATIKSIKIQFKNNMKQKLTDEQRKVYLDTYIEVEKIITNQELIFERNYYNKLESCKSKIKLAGSNRVIDAYCKYMKFVWEMLSKMEDWVSRNDPNANEYNFEPAYDQKYGEYEINHVTEDMEDQFRKKYKEYKQNNIPEQDEIIKKVDELLNVMRRDLGNESYKRSIL